MLSRSRAQVAAADIAGASGDLGAVAEVIQDGAAAALRPIGVVENLVELAAGVLLQRGDLRRRELGVVVANLVDEEFLGVLVARTAIQNALRGAAIAAGAARLLVIGFEAGGNVVVHHKADVGLVDPHAKGVGGNDHRAGVVHEVFLALLAGGSIHAGVVGADGAVRETLLKQGGQLFHQAAGGAINNAAALLLGEAVKQRAASFSASVSRRRQA